MERTVEPEEAKSRRDVLRALGAAAAGTLAGSMLSAKEAQASHGTLNASSSTGNPAIHGENTSSVANGPGVLGTAPSGFGVQGTSESGVGVAGNSIEGTGVSGNSSRGAGVIGSTADGTGVSGDSFMGIGVNGHSDDGIGVRAFTFTGIGVHAEGPTALEVQGTAKFSTAGFDAILANQDSAMVSNVFVTALSHITVTLTGDPGQAGSAQGFKPVVVWVERQPGTGFIVHMSRPVRVDTPLTYLIVEPV
jgi:hypothetical protein